MWGKFRRALCAIVMVLLLLEGAALAQSVNDDEYKAKFLVSDDATTADVDIFAFKRKLQEEGFYVSGISEEELRSPELDLLTMAAVKMVTDYNPDLIYYNDGVSNQLFWRVMGEVAGLKSPRTEGDGGLQLGDRGEAVTTLQNRLSKLGYGASGQDFTSGVYDERMQDAVDDFVRCNKLVYLREEGVPAQLQQEILSENAVAYSVSGAGLSLYDKVLRYMGGRAGLLGVYAPVWAFYLAGFALLCIIAFLILRLCGGKKEKPEATPAVTAQYVAPGKGEATFKIEYNGESCFFRTKLRDVIVVGRSQSGLPLNPEDGSVSRTQCEMIPDQGKLRLRNRSRGGTLLNGDRLQEVDGRQTDDRFLHNGDVLEFGRHRVTVFLQE